MIGGEVSEVGNGTPFCIGLRMRRVFGGKGVFGTLVTGRTKTLILEELAICWPYRGEPMAVISPGTLHNAQGEDEGISYVVK